jgi:aerobic carbon-monoxide dehydrogenase medium subunit
MKPAPFTYHAPETLEAALQLLDTLDNARVLAGGQSLVPMLNFRVAQPDHLIDLGYIPELATLERSKDRLRVGAMTTQRTLERSALVKEHCPILVDALHHVGHQQTRNRGTIGGSLCHLDPAAELPVVAMALDPVLTIASFAGMRELPFQDFPAGCLTPQLEPNEILLSIDFPAWPTHCGWAFMEFARRPADFAIVSVAAMLTTSNEGLIESARVAVGGLVGIPLRGTVVEKCLIGERINESLDRAAEAVRALPADGDSNYPAEYRQDLADALLRRTLAEAWERSRRSHG